MPEDILDLIAEVQPMMAQQRQAAAQEETALVRQQGLLPAVKMPVTPETLRRGLAEAAETGRPPFPAEGTVERPVYTPKVGEAAAELKGLPEGNAPDYLATGTERVPAYGRSIFVTPEPTEAVRKQAVLSLFKRREEGAVSPGGKIISDIERLKREGGDPGQIAALEAELARTAKGTQTYETALRRDFRSDQAVKDFRDIRQKAANMESALAASKGQPETFVAIDQALITMFNKMLDPQSVVRESEYARTPADQSLWTRLKGKAQAILSGGAGLTTIERDALVRMARQFAQTATARYRESEAFYRNIAEESGIDPAKIIPKFTEREEPEPTASGGTPSRGKTAEELIRQYGLER